MIRRLLIGFGAAVALVAAGLFAYGATGWFDARRDAPALRSRAQAAIAAGRGPRSLPPDRLSTLLRVQDPAFFTHAGVDLSTPGAGMTTLSQSLAKRLAFVRFRPGIGKLRQTGYALALDRHVSKEHQLALFLDTAEMGQSGDSWIVGFHRASEVFFGASPAAISEDQYLALVAVLIAPGQLRLSRPDDALRERVGRIRRLSTGQCSPAGWRDVWLEGCR